MISAKIVADSVNGYTGERLITYEVVAHRYILAEINTHKMLSKNSASSRAIPLSAQINEVINNTAYPVEWRKNQAGMVASTEFTEEEKIKAFDIWTSARDSIVSHVKQLDELKLHKQWANRLQEPFAYQKMLISGTEWDNWFWLRICSTAQPEIDVLARAMLKARLESTPETLWYGEYHTPYVTHRRNEYGLLEYVDVTGKEISLEDALKISASCGAQISYRKLDDTMEKADKVFNMLNLGSQAEDAKSHSSPTEHSGTPIHSTLFKNNRYLPFTWETGVTHTTRDGRMGSGNFYGFIQYRHLFKNESCEKFDYSKYM
jgi:thymidylate synthase ThyX